MKYIINLIMIIFFLQACSENSSEPQNADHLKPALIIVVENNDGLIDDELIQLEGQYRDKLLDVLSSMFEVDNSKMQDMELGEIVEIYGEEWQLNSIEEAAAGKYGKIIKLTDDNADYDTFLNSCTDLSEQGYFVDAVFALHASEDFIAFYEDQVPVINLTNDLRESGISLRSLYQTCCYSKEHFDAWNDYGIKAVNGASGYNILTLFSPQYFIEEWLNGEDFEKAVKKAKERELEKLYSYKSIFPGIELVYSGAALEGSQQNITGKKKDLKWNDFISSYYTSK